MQRDLAISTLRQAAPVLRQRYGVTSARLFGSVARGDNDGVSDVDVAVCFNAERRPDVMKLCGVSRFLSSLFNADVDVVAEPARDPSLAAAIEREGVIAF